MNAHRTALFSTLALGLALSSTAFAQTPILNYTFDGQPTTVGAGYSTTTPSGSGYALDLPNTGTGYFNASSDVGSINGLSSFTLTFWLNLEAAPAVNDRILSTLTAAAGPGLDLRFAGPGSGTFSASDFRLQLQIDSDTNLALSNDLSASGQWTFIAVTLTDTAGTNVRFYSGGVAATAVASGTGTLADRSIGTSSAFRIGSTPASGSDRTPPALLDEVRFYNTALDINQIEQIRLEGVTTVPEPSTYAAIVGGLFLAGTIAYRRRQF